METEKQRIIQEYVPGKQISLVHIIANPDRTVCEQVGIDEESDAIGILTITPGEAAIIAADVATKAADVTIGYMDRFNGSLVITGDVASVESAVQQVAERFEATLKFAVGPVTRS